MWNSFFLTLIAIFFTAASYFCAFYIVEKRRRLLGSIVIGTMVVLTGYLMAVLHAPLWLIIAAPIPLGFLIMFYLVKSWRTTIVVYITTWGFYLVFHILLSALAHYDSLLPSWRLRP